ncbi:MAG: hypothetical protein FJZ90_03015 [Chloroflexi bacterium]|nr:hypothetical protein [Chloroflexota bacterium]
MCADKTIGQKIADYNAAVRTVMSLWGEHRVQEAPLVLIGLALTRIAEALERIAVQAGDPPDLTHG